MLRALYPINTTDYMLFECAVCPPDFMFKLLIIIYFSLKHGECLYSLSVIKAIKMMNCRKDQEEQKTTVIPVPLTFTTPKEYTNANITNRWEQERNKWL